MQRIRILFQSNFSSFKIEKWSNHELLGVLKALTTIKHYKQVNKIATTEFNSIIMKYIHEIPPMSVFMELALCSSAFYSMLQLHFLKNTDVPYTMIIQSSGQR